MTDLDLPEIVGFSGTQYGMTSYQENTTEQMLQAYYANGYTKARQGCCIGADEQFTILADKIGFEVIGHPPIKTAKISKVAVKLCKRLWEPDEYLVRDHDIVAFSNRLLFTPHQNYETTRGGTWATVRYALNAHKMGWIIWPNGDADPLSKFWTDRSLGRTIRQ